MKKKLLSLKSLKITAKLSYNWEVNTTNASVLPGTNEYAIVQMDQRLFLIKIRNAESAKQKT
jgi:hypothetical protein